MTGYRQINRREWYVLGGLENARLARKQSSRGWWTYWIRTV